MNDRVANIFRRWRQPQPAAQPRCTDSSRAETEDARVASGTGPHAQSPPGSLRYPRTTLGRLLDQTADRFPDLPAIIPPEARSTNRSSSA
jgi:hypothetical protein